jgi:hypothetical protein
MESDVSTASTEKAICVKCLKYRYGRFIYDKKDKINELATNSKNMNIRNLYRGINEFNRGYQPRSKLVKDENADLLAESHNILNRSKNYFSQLLNVHRFSDAFFLMALPVHSGPRLLIQFCNHFSKMEDSLDE